LLNSFYDKFIFTNALKYKHSNFYLLNLPFVIAPSDLFLEMLALDDEFQKKLYSAVKKSTKSNLIKKFSLDFGFKGEKLVNFLETYFMASGWGEIKTVDVDFKDHKAIVMVGNSPFGNGLHGKVSKPCDHLLRGVFAGVFSKAFNVDVDCVEVHCTAIGGNDCEFIIKRPGEFDLGNKHVLSQLELDI
jgi:predicted hydrocarbon binding protein